MKQSIIRSLGSVVLITGLTLLNSNKVHAEYFQHRIAVDGVAWGGVVDPYTDICELVRTEFPICTYEKYLVDGREKTHYVVTTPEPWVPLPRDYWQVEVKGEKSTSIISIEPGKDVCQEVLSRGIQDAQVCNYIRYEKRPNSSKGTHYVTTFSDDFDRIIVKDISGESIADYLVSAGTDHQDSVSDKLGIHRDRIRWISGELRDIEEYQYESVLQVWRDNLEFPTYDRLIVQDVNGEILDEYIVPSRTDHRQSVSDRLGVDMNTIHWTSDNLHWTDAFHRDVFITIDPASASNRIIVRDMDGEIIADYLESAEIDHRKSVAEHLGIGVNEIVWTKGSEQSSEDYLYQAELALVPPMNERIIVRNLDEEILGDYIVPVGTRWVDYVSNELGLHPQQFRWKSGTVVDHEDYQFEVEVTMWRDTIVPSNQERLVIKNENQEIITTFDVVRGTDHIEAVADELNVAQESVEWVSGGLQYGEQYLDEYGQSYIYQAILIVR